MRTRWRRILWPRWARRPVRRFARAPLGRLVRHFLDKMVRGGQDQSSELDLGAGALLGFLAAPGAFTSLLMLDKYSALLNWFRGHLRDDLYVTSVPDKYLFLCVAMAVTGIVTALKWDQLLPDPQDYLNLAPLPVRPRRILLANALAILVAVAIISVDVSAVPAVLFPGFVMAAARSTFTAFAQFAVIHIFCVVLASVFSIASVFTILGTASAVLPRATFRAWSAWLRGALLLAFLALLLSGFAGASLTDRLHSESPIRFLPSMWFLALYQQLQHRATPVLEPMARWALAGLASSIVAAAVACTASYRRSFASTLEGGPAPSRQHALAAILWVLDAFAPRRAGFARAAHRFAVRALLRSETHRLTIAVALGLGGMAALQDNFGASLGCGFLLLLGLRVAFEIPAGVPANWIFRAILDTRTNETQPIARRVMLSFLVPLVLAPCMAVAWLAIGPVYAVGHTAFVLALSVAVIELLLNGYRKVPLTCPMPGFRDHFLMLCLIQFVGYEVFTRAGAAMETWMWAAPWRFALVPLAMAWAWHWNRGRLAEAREAGEVEEGLTFENVSAPAVTRMDLSGG